MTDDLVKLLRDEESYYRVQEKHWCIDAEELERQRLAAADRIEALTAENERLRAAGNDLATIPGHSPTCGWEDGASCTCGYSEVAEAWGRAALTGKADQ